MILIDLNQAEYQAAVIEADNLRRCQAYQIAICNLGPMPPAKPRRAFLDYIARLNREAEVIFRRTH